MANNNLTKIAIATSIKKLMKSKSISKISVSDICRDCNINRKTFYYHFGDKYELLIWIFKEEVIDYTFEKCESIHSYEGALCFLTCLYNDANFYRKAFQEMGPHSLRDYFGQIIKPIVEDVIEADDYDIEIITLSESFSDFLVSSFLRWLTGYPVLPPDEYLEQLISVGSVLSIKLAKLFYDVINKDN
ncbi:MAG: TetR family transcriptional regulator [Pleomorphochaeta sp.]